MNDGSRLLVGASETCSDVLYATKFFAPDDVIWFSHQSKTYLILSNLEIDRGRAQARVDKILSLSDFAEKLESKLNRRPFKEEVILEAFQQRDIAQAEVPLYFPIHIADFLRNNGVNISVCEDEFFPERKTKNAEEIKHITRALRIAEAGMERAFEILRASKIRGKFLHWGQEKLTSEILRGEIDATMVRLGGLPSRTIVACGRQACDPHEVGHGVLKPHHSIIIDIFPRDQKTGYYGDLSRTVVKGRASSALTRLYETVFKEQARLLQILKPGISGAMLHRSLLSNFEQAGYPTELRNGRWVGFFHGTGHSIGLEIHEPPRFMHTDFYEGLVMTVEPGLYYPEIGGVRLEDLIVVTKNGNRNLTKIPKFLEIH
ncbi:MAG: M24 family metallopeptidase [Verrucomicrobiota bacterium]